MVRYSIFAGFLGSLLILSSCSEDFQLTEPYKDIPVVYGIIKRSDTAQYIRVQKAFVDENLAASQIAKNPDSLYYLNPEVKLINATTKKEYTLYRVDGNLEGYPREAGPFATAPNYLYKFLTKDLTISGGDQLILSIDRKNGTQPVTATIVAVGDLLFSFPDDMTRQLRIFYSNSYNFQWKNQSNTTVFDLKALVYIDEFDLATQQILASKVIEIPFGSNLPGKTGQTVNISSTKINGSTLYQFLHDKLATSASIGRYLNKIDFYLTGGGPEFQTYLNILNANTGITASQEIPRYTNLSEGFGIFTSTYTVKKTITLQPPSLDSLQAHPLTRDLNFR